MNKTILRIAFVLSFSMMISQAFAEVVKEPEIKTSTVGKVVKLAWPLFYMNKVSVASPDSPQMAEVLAASFAKSGYKIETNPEKPTYTIIRDFRGKAADYTPQSSNQNKRNEGWFNAFLSLGIDVLIGQKMGVINTNNLLQSNSDAVAATLQQASQAYGKPGENEERIKEAEKVKNETNLVVYRLCYSGSCAYALSAGEADLDQLDEACFKGGILKLAGQEE